MQVLYYSIHWHVHLCCISQCRSFPLAPCTRTSCIHCILMFLCEPFDTSCDNHICGILYRIFRTPSCNCYHRLLQNQPLSSGGNSSSSRLVLTPPPGASFYSTPEDFQRPVSSSKDLSTSSSSQEQPIKSRSILPYYVHVIVHNIYSQSVSDLVYNTCTKLCTFAFLFTAGWI